MIVNTAFQHKNIIASINMDKAASWFGAVLLPCVQVNLPLLLDFESWINSKEDLGYYSMNWRITISESCSKTTTLNTLIHLQQAVFFIHFSMTKSSPMLWKDLKLQLMQKTLIWSCFVKRKKHSTSKMALFNVYFESPYLWWYLSFNSNPPSAVCCRVISRQCIRRSSNKSWITCSRSLGISKAERASWLSLQETDEKKALYTNLSLY